MTRIFRDSLPLLLLTILAIPLLAFAAGVLPYPLGLLILSVFMLVRILRE